MERSAVEAFDVDCDKTLATVPYAGSVIRQSFEGDFPPADLFEHCPSA